MNEDLGDDAVKATKYGVKNLKYIMSHMSQWLSGDDVTMENRADLLQDIVQQYALYSVHVASNVFGYYRNEAKEGDGQQRIVALNRQRQKEALDYYFTLYEDLDWMDNRQLLGKMAMAGSPATTLRTYLQRTLFALPILVSRYNNIDAKSLQPREALDMVFDFVWKPTRQGKALTEWQRTLQKAYLMDALGNSGFQLPKSAQQLTADPIPGLELRALCCTEMGDVAREEALAVSPYAGFEQTPREQFNLRATLTQSDLYACVAKARQLLRSRLGSATGETRAHYELLLKQMDSIIK
jgi:hypothetical protein